LKRVLITGANGFIGQAMCNHLLAQEWQVLGAIRRSDSRCDLPKGTLACVVGEIGPHTHWDRFLRNVDTVIHLAARVHHPEDKSQAIVKKYHETNTIGTGRLLKAAINSKVRRFIFVSSVKVNGEGRDRPYRENDPPAPVDAYGTTKADAENLVNFSWKKAKIETTILRPPLVYGKGVRANFLQLMKLVEKGMPMPFAAIDSQRSFIYLENLIHAIDTCISHRHAVGKTFLVCDDETMAIPDLIGRLSRAMGKQARLFAVPKGLLSLLERVPGAGSSISKVNRALIVDNNKIREELGWNPLYSVDEGIRETVKWYLGHASYGCDR